MKQIQIQPSPHTNSLIIPSPPPLSYSATITPTIPTNPAIPTATAPVAFGAAPVAFVELAAEPAAVPLPLALTVPALPVPDALVFAPELVPVAVVFPAALVLVTVPPATVPVAPVAAPHPVYVGTVTVYPLVKAASWELCTEYQLSTASS